MTRFGYPVELFSDQGSHVINEAVQNLTSTDLIIHKKSTMHYPQANDLAESTNKTLRRILKKIVNEHRRIGTCDCNQPYGQAAHQLTKIA